MIQDCKKPAISVHHRWKNNFKLRKRSTLSSTIISPFFGIKIVNFKYTHSPRHQLSAAHKFLLVRIMVGCDTRFKLTVQQQLARHFKTDDTYSINANIIIARTHHPAAPSHPPARDCTLRELVEVTFASSWRQLRERYTFLPVLLHVYV